MNTKVADLMMAPVMTTTKHQTFGHVRNVLNEHRASCLPVVDSDGVPIGVVTTNDMMEQRADGCTVSEFMTDKVFTVPQTSDVSLAARIMRNHHIHHVVVTDKKKVVGMISSFDLLQLVEDHRFVMKNPPTESNRKGGKRRQEEVLNRPK